MKIMEIRTIGWLLLLTFMLSFWSVRSSFAAAKQCGVIPDPVVSLSFGSRYKDDSQSRSDIDEESDADVTRALMPVDAFVQDLMRDANSVRRAPLKNKRLARCALAAIDHWAKLDALSDLRTTNAKLAVPSRLGGIAIAYAQLGDLRQMDPAARSRIESWLRTRAEATMSFFDNEAPKGASRNNLRAWAGLAVGQVGIIVGDQAMISWSAETVGHMIADANPDGSLPLEMKRAKYALHYQLHAVAPLVAATALLCETGNGRDQDMVGLRKIVDFSLNGLEDPATIELVAGAPQQTKRGFQNNRGMLAWLEPYVALTGDTRAGEIAATIGPLQNSKLGGDLTRIYNGRRIPCDDHVR
jgi:poly(beta-D-mannuronate) lyase